jgi:hypothetical protein
MRDGGAGGTTGAAHPRCPCRVRRHGRLRWRKKGRGGNLTPATPRARELARVAGGGRSPFRGSERAIKPWLNDRRSSEASVSEG